MTSALAALACSNSASGPGPSASGGAVSSGGVATGGVATGGLATGGAATGGVTATSGGTATGGAPTGGSSGSSSTGGTSTSGGTSASGGTSTTSGGSSNTGGIGGGTAGGGQAGGGATGSGGGTPEATTECKDMASLSGTLTGAMDSQTIEVPVVGKDKSYQLHTNWWHKYTNQAVDYSGLSFTIKDPGNTSVPQTDGAPTGFPTLFIGTYAGHATKGSNLPKQVSAIQSVPTVFSTNALAHDTSNYNATYDVWFTATGDTLPATQFNPGKGGAYLMVWYYDPAQRQPRGGMRNGTTTVANVGAHTVEGVPGTWDVWIDRTDPLCISYVSTTPRDSLEFDLNKFIQDSVKNNYGITASMYLSIVFAGFEIWGGGDGLQTKQFCAKVN
ncbi:MAG TPA: hypothetical protein VFQ61_36335 [Polyangiaceae bacterium]|nr:hypothetical protein [Polyangiaceae bacterium]